MDTKRQVNPEIQKRVEAEIAAGTRMSDLAIIWTVIFQMCSERIADGDDVDTAIECLWQPEETRVQAGSPATVATTETRQKG